MTRGRLVVAALLVGACSTSTDAGPAVAVDPAALYSQMCARCHGLDGHGDPLLKTQMQIRDFSDPEVRRVQNQEMEQVIMAGRKQMPGFGAMLSLPKIQTLTGYVRRLGAK
jgi:mono/diheme cytochrome c family protein